jgi:hypothetical protein
MTLGFMTLVIAEYVYLLNSTEDLYRMFIPHVNIEVSHVNIEVSHVILLVMVMFFGISFLKTSR